MNHFEQKSRVAGEAISKVEESGKGRPLVVGETISTPIVGKGKPKVQKNPEFEVFEPEKLKLSTQKDYLTAAASS